MVGARRALGVLAIWLLAGMTPAEGRQDGRGLPTPGSSAPVSSDTTAPSLATIESLLEHLAALQRRVEALERELAARDAGIPAPTPLPAQPPTGLHEHLAAAASAQVPEQQTQYPALRIHGFADVNFVETDDPGPAGFHMGQLVLHLASAIGPKVNVFAEASFAPRSVRPDTTVPTSYATDIERAFIRYDHSDAFKLSFGRYHTPTSYWNNAYHHGLFLQTTISRPEMIEFGNPFLPVHFIGVLAEGTLPATRLGIGYSAGVGNGRASLITRAGDAGDSNDHKAWVATLRSRPERINGLEAGLSLYRDRFRPERGAEMDEWITGAHVAWTVEAPELIAEFINVRHAMRATGSRYNSTAFYVQGAYRLPWHDARWKPYYRFDTIDAPLDEPVLGLLDVRTSTVGVRYDVADFAAFKGEYRRTRRQQETRQNGFFLQTSFTF